MIRKYPIGIQSFREIRQEGYLYVDKTGIIHRMVETGKYYFLSRPRRFGKSLLVDTIEELFRGSRELFEGLWIADKWDWSKTNPVIHFNFAEFPYKEVGLEESIRRTLAGIADQLEVALSSDNIKDGFRELIQKVSAKHGKVVVLIDEYDKVLIDYLDDPEQLDANRSVMKSFYSILKGQDGNIRFLLMTGVSRFSRVSIFSDLNNLEDITIDDNFHNIVGITQAELERDFAAEIEELQESQPDILSEIREWYNGYSWGGKDTLYNPFSLLNYMKSRRFANHWYTTGTPTFLFKHLKKRKLADMDGAEVSLNTLAEFELDRLNMVSVLFQTGYLTIRELEGQLCVMGYPNREVKESLLDGLLNVYRESDLGDSLSLITALRRALQKADVPAMIAALDSLIGQIPYDHWRGDTESIFHIITVLTFRLAGVEVQTEVHSAKGRCDVLVKTDSHIYVLELKLDGTAEEALQQIQQTDYLQPYTADPRQKLAIGIAFSSEERKVAGYLVQE